MGITFLQDSQHNPHVSPCCHFGVDVCKWRCSQIINIFLVPANPFLRNTKVNPSSWSYFLGLSWLERPQFKQLPSSCRSGYHVQIWLWRPSLVAWSKLEYVLFFPTFTTINFFEGLFYLVAWPILPHHVHWLSLVAIPLSPKSLFTICFIYRIDCYSTNVWWLLNYPCPPYLHGLPVSPEQTKHFCAIWVWLSCFLTEFNLQRCVRK